MYNSVNLAVYSGSPLANLMLFNAVNVVADCANFCYLKQNYSYWQCYIAMLPTGLGVYGVFMCKFGAPENKFIAISFLLFF